MLSECERILGQGLLRLPQKHNYRYGPEAEKDLLQLLFKSLTGHNEQRLRQLFPEGLPAGPWKLAEAQGAKEGAEYSESARGKRCGHIFRAGEATYRCVTCAADDTCVLCSRCFDSSDHTGHQYQISVSLGNCGCCDCGDEEAWRLPLFCAIHTDSGSKKGKERAQNPVPQDWVAYIKLTIARVMDYFCDVISCSPEQLRLPKTEEAIRQDEVASRLHAGWYGEGDQEEQEPEFALALWNDEKHTIRDVSRQVTRACRERDSFGVARAHETNDIGRSIVKYSKDLQRLLAVSKIIEQIKVTVTLRSARDTFREQMCGTIVEWLTDISGCSVLEDNELLRHVICEELMNPWRRGSGAYNADIGLRGIDDHQKSDSVPFRTVMLTVSPQGHVMLAADDDDGDDDEEEGTGDEGLEEEGEENAVVAANLGDEDDEEDEDYVDAQDDADDEEEEMEAVLSSLRGDNIDEDGDVEMGNTDGNEDPRDPYQPPAPPPQGSQYIARDRHQSRADHNRVYGAMAQIPIPRTPSNTVNPPPARTPGYWQVRPSVPVTGEGVPPYEDLWQRTRLDWMILYDLRLWKKTRTDLRDLYIATVVNVPQFKRIMGLRLSALYTALAQLYLIADREPDHSIVNLSLQLLTTPSITEEIVQRGNFLTKVMAILYTFLTTRQVGEPYEVNPNATLAFDAGSVTNRRLYHFFLDLRYLLQSEYVQHHVRTEKQYLPQFLDLVKLSQGLCPNLRAVGEHVEYETDAWISASILMREINRLCRQFCEAFRHPQVDSGQNLARAINTAAITAIVHSTGIERQRFQQAEITDYVRFKLLPCFDFEVDHSQQVSRHRVVDFVVEKGYISFHHALHYTLSWLLECGRDVSSGLMRDILLESASSANNGCIHDSRLSAEDLLLVMFDYPLRVCAWLAQMKAGMWVRNGLSLRHQMSQYRGVSSRDFAYYRDIFLLQTAMVTCDPSRVLASIADRFGMVDWMSRNYVPRPGYEDSQIIDVAEDFVHLLVILLTDRNSLTAIDDDINLTRENMMREIAHVLCFKALSFTDLSTKLSDKLADSDMFQDILDEVANFRAPEGLNDTGTFELKSEFIGLIDPYSAHYNKNQRDEAENIYREWVAKKTGKKASDVVFEPKLQHISSGMFSDLPRFTKTPLFAQIVHHCLDYIVSFKYRTPNIPATRIETFLHMVLHLILTATLEDNTDEFHGTPEASAESFISHSLTKSRLTQVGNVTIIGLLEKVSSMGEFESSSAKIRHILRKFWQKRPQAYMAATASLSFPFDRVDTASPAVDADTEKEHKENKKKQALERQARVMAQFQQQQQNFLNSQGGVDWGGEDFSDGDEPEEQPTAPESKMWKYPSGTCILCQEETNDSRLYGTFVLVQESGILRQTDVRDPDWIREGLNTPSNLDKSADSLRPFGVAGENRTTVKKLDSTGKEVISEKVGLSKGLDPKCTRPGPVTTGCGHIMHYSCFEVYYTATHRRHGQQIARHHPERLSLNEFVCPLCKALGNMFLPIIWKGKEESYPGALNATMSFEQFMADGVGSALSEPQNYLVMTEGNRAHIEQYQNVFKDYLTKSLVPPLASKVDQLIYQPVTSQFSSLSSQFMQSARTTLPGLFPASDDATLMTMTPLGSSRSTPPESNPLIELLQIYKRLKKSLTLNNVYSAFEDELEPYNRSDELLFTDALIRSFGFSIASVEIAQRGVECEQGATLLDKIPQLTLTHLRVLAETALSYAAVGYLHSVSSSKHQSPREFQEMHGKKIFQLFAGHSALRDSPFHNFYYRIDSLLAVDTFVFLAECSLSLLPVLNIDIRHLIQTCYVAEIVKVFATFILWPQALKEELAQHGDAQYLLDVELSDDNVKNTKHVFDFVVAQLRAKSTPLSPITSGYVKNGETSATPAVIIALGRLISSYALTFLRKTVILLHVQHGVEFPNTGFTDSGSSELDRLTAVLKLPTLSEIFSSINPDGKSDDALTSVISGWISHWSVWQYLQGRKDPQMDLSLPHPGIFELVGLPEYYDNLIEEANRRRCPSSKKELSDPSICLFCGDIFCSQAVCCMNGNLGGCNQHLRKYVI